MRSRRTRPDAQAGPVGGVVVIHHLPGYDRQTEEFTRAFAAGGLNAVMPNLYHREAPGAAPDDAMAAARASGAIPIPDERIVGEVAGAAAYLRGLSQLQRQDRRDRPLLRRPAGVPRRGQPAARRGRRLLRRLRRRDPARGSSAARLAAAGRAGPRTCPARCSACSARRTQHPSPEHVAELEAALKAQGKTYEFHSYDGAGHAFMQVDRPSYRPEAAVDAWQHIWAWFGRYLLSSDLRGVRYVHLPDGKGPDQRQRQGPDRMDPGDRRQRVLRPPGARPGRAYAQHRLPRPGRGPVGAGRGRAHRGIGAGPGARRSRPPWTPPLPA